MKNKQKNELAVCGFATVKKLEKNHPEKITRLYFTEEVAPKFGGLCKKLAKNHGIYNQKPAVELEKLCGSVHHQGVVAMIEAPKIEQLDSDITDSWVENHENAVLLDRIGNANNFGAIIRSAAFFGIKNIVIPMDEAQTSITTSSYRVAEGGMEYVNIYYVNSTARLLEALKGKMIRVGTDLQATKKASDLGKMVGGEKPVLIVLGNEEHGISDIVKKNCDELVIIPWDGMAENYDSAVDSLNVAQASSILFYEMMKK
ncbi:MAG: RNA methyltransferase [Treponema sp.]|nr:RNA methyltransferase [Spirochaetia bacterium]MDY2838974.1 RNA methyltransferase [Treponema sp.]